MSKSTALYVLNIFGYDTNIYIIYYGHYEAPRTIIIMLISMYVCMSGKWRHEMFWDFNMFYMFGFLF